MQIVLNLYRSIFTHPVFYRFNYHVQRVSLRGVGVFNSEGNEVTGETFLLHILSKKPRMNTFVDVGANAGGYSQEIKAIFPKATIYAIEPHPQTFQKLKTYLRGSSVKLRNIGLGERNGRGKLWDFSDDAELKTTQPTSTLASSVKEVITSYHHQKAQAYSFQILTLDAFAKKEHIQRIDLLKIDTEGTELAVLKGAQTLLKEKRIRYVQFEFNEMNVYSRTFFKDFMDLLPGYTFYRLMPHGFYPLGPYRPSTHEVFAFQNVIAVPDGERIE